MQNLVIVHLRTEKGCNPTEGEYSLFLVSMLTPLEIGGSGSDDVPLIEECIENAIAERKHLLPEHLLPEDGLIEIRLKESGEQQDVFWVKYYEVEDWQVIMLNKPELE